MAFSSLASNQMVSEADAATGGFALQSGQSHGSSNQCMTKAMATTKYQLNTSLLSSYADNQLIPKGVWANPSVTGYANSFAIYNPETNNANACNIGNAGGIDYGYLYSSTPTISVSTVLYTDSALTTTFNGGSNYYYGEDNNSYQINSSGEVLSITVCTEQSLYSILMAETSDDSTGVDACTNQTSLDTVRFLDGAGDNPAIGDTMYEDVYGFTVFNGNDMWWRFYTGAEYQSIKINSSGVITDIANC